MQNFSVHFDFCLSRSNKGAVGNSVTTILHNNYSEKPLTPKSSNQKPTFKYELNLTSHDLDPNGLTSATQVFVPVVMLFGMSNGPLHTQTTYREHDTIHVSECWD